MFISIRLCMYFLFILTGGHVAARNRALKCMEFEITPQRVEFCESRGRGFLSLSLPLSVLGCERDSVSRVSGTQRLLS
jgi:hypothetical protein